MTREDAIKILKGGNKRECTWPEYSEAYNMAIKVLEQEPKTGHWIPTYGNVKCSVCGRAKDRRDVGKSTHYCDFCGAKMKSEE